MLRTGKVLVIIFLLGANLLHAQQLSDSYEPEHSTKTSSVENASAEKQAGMFERAIVVSANRHATNAGLNTLKAGGNAVDAMVAVQLVLGLVEPQSSGLGGGAFTLLYDAEQNRLRTFDARETAPLSAPSSLFLKKDQSPMSFFDAVVGGRSVGTPGTVALLWKLHQEKGKLPWATLFEPALELAKKGFAVSPRLAQSIARDKKRLLTHPNTARYFLPDGNALAAGHILKNPDYFRTLNLLSKNGGNYFYSQAFTKEIIDQIQTAKNRGYLSQEDFDAYQVKERAPVCSSVFEHRVCGMGPPSSGAMTVNQILSLTERALPKNSAAESPEAWHIVAEASRRAFADRNRYMADTDFVKMPDWLLNPRYLDLRAQEILLDRRSPAIHAGEFKPVQTDVRLYSDGIELSMPSTTHFVIVDAQGNIISTTSTIENGFGSRIMVHGFLLNNELTDFSFARSNDKGLIANRVEPGKRPRSSMAPTIVFKNEKPVLAIGSPGGSRIINYVANSLLRSLLWKQDVREIVKAPHYSNRSGIMDVELNTVSTKSINAFEDFGYTVNARDLNSGLHAVEWVDDQLIGAADPRREGTVAGY